MPNIYYTKYAYKTQQKPSKIFKVMGYKIVTNLSHRQYKEYYTNICTGSQQK